MVQILQFVLPDQTFDADATAALIAAYDKAIKELHDRGQPELVCEVIAKRIIAATAAGERDPGRLCEVGLAGLQTTH